MGPPFSAVKVWPASSNCAVITEPSGFWCWSNPAFP
jgi:hypothetical protein